MKMRMRLSSLVARIRGSIAVDDLIIFLLLTGVLAIYIGLQLGDDWYVKEFATYDWARGLGY